MWMSIKTMLQNKNLLVIGMILSIVPVVMIFMLIVDMGKMNILYKHSIAVQSKLDDLDEHIKDWVIASKSKELQSIEKESSTLNIVNKDLISLQKLVEKNAIPIERADEIKQLWTEMTTTGATTMTLSRIDRTIDLIDKSEGQVVSEKEAEIDEQTQLAKTIAVISIFLGVLLTLVSVLVMNRNLENERKLNAQLKISEAKATESSKLKASFLATVSHEIRTPLNGIIGLSDLLTKMNLKDEEFRFVEIIHASGKTLLKIINDILDYSKIESGKIELEESEFSVTTVIEQVISTLKPKAFEKGIHLDSEIDENLPKVLVGDPSRISQVLYNLTGNAIKFTSVGSVVIKVNLDSIIENTSAKIRFSVTDTGNGLSEEDQEKLFQPFVQLQKIGTSGEAGTGLGLSIARQLIRAMHSDIYVDSKKGSGSRFYFSINFLHFSNEKIGANSVSTNDRLLNRPNEAIAIFDEIEKPMILVVEDNPTNQITVQAMLERLGANVIIASNGAESLDLVLKTEVNLIFMDCQMPVMGGFEATQQMRKNRVTLPIVAMTANASKEDQRTCEAAGMNGFISKPISIDVLKSELARFLKPEPNFISLDVLQKLEEAIGSTGKSKVVRAFLKGLPEMRESLNLARSQQNIDAIHKIGHRCKSSADTVGAKGLAHLFRKLEKVDQFETALQVISEIELSATAVELKLIQHISQV